VQFILLKRVFQGLFAQAMVFSKASNADICEVGIGGGFLVDESEIHKL